MVEEMELRELITHSLIVGALLAFSLSAHAGAITMDGISVDANPVAAVANSNAVLHRDVGLQQGGGNGKDVVEAPVVDNDCSASSACAAVPRVETLQDLLAVNRSAPGAGTLIVLLLFALIGIVVLSRRSPSTK